MAFDNSIIPDPSVLTGSEVLVFLNNERLAFATDISPDYNYNLQEIRGIGSWFPLGVKSMMFTGTFSANLHLLALREDGAPRLPVLEEILTAGPLLFELREKGTDRRIMRLICKLSTESTNFANNALSSRRTTFMIQTVQHLEAYN